MCLEWLTVEMKGVFHGEKSTLIRPALSPVLDYQLFP